MNKLLLMKKSIAILLTLVILLSLAGSAMAQENRVSSGRSMPTARQHCVVMLANAIYLCGSACV